MKTVKRLTSSLLFVVIGLSGLSGRSVAQGRSNAWTTGGPEGDYSQITVLTARENVLFAASNRGVFKSSNGGDRWDLILPEGSITSLTIDPKDPSVIFATRYSFNGRSLFKTTDGGRSWRVITAGLSYSSSYPQSLSVWSLAIDPMDSRVVYAGAGGGDSGFGVFLKSLDGGESWQSVSGAVPVVVMDLKIDPEDGRTLYAVTSGPHSSGLFKITDGGRKWTNIGAGLPHDRYGYELNARTLVIDPHDHSTLYVTLSGYGVYRSRDAGATWQPVNEGLPRLETWSSYPTIEALSWGHDGTLYAGLNPYGLFKSVDGGDHWTPMNFGSGITDVSPGVGPRSLIYVAGPSGIYRSADGGDSWSDASQGLIGSSISALATDPTMPGAVYAGGVYFRYGLEGDLGNGRWTPPDRSRSGVFRSLDRGRTWSATSLDGYVRALAVDPRIGWIYAATDRGLFKSEDHGVTWHGLPGPSPTEISVIAIDPRHSIVYVGTWSSGFHKSEDGGNSWQAIDNGSPPGRFPIGSLAIDPLDTRVIFVATLQFGVYKTVDGGGTWTKLNHGLTYRYGLYDVIDREVNCIAIDPSHPQTIYVGTTDSLDPTSSGVYRSDDGGMSWRSAGDGLQTQESRWVHDLAIDPRNGQNVYIVTGDGLHQSHGEDISWLPMNEGFSDLGTGNIALDPHASGALYAGTGAGVFTLEPLPEKAVNIGAAGKEK